MNSPAPVIGVLGLFDERSQNVSGLGGKRPAKADRPPRQKDLPRKILGRCALAGGVKRCGKCGRSALKFLLGEKR
jgi:hypothetical protein